MSNYGYMILPDGKYYSLDDFNTLLNNNVLVVGTTGAAKTRTVVTPNLLECVGSYIVTDPKEHFLKARREAYHAKKAKDIELPLSKAE